jgi:hypothetical protein
METCAPHPDILCVEGHLTGMGVERGRLIKGGEDRESIVSV